VPPNPPYRVFLGFSADEIQAYNVAELSLKRHTNRQNLDVRRICMLSLYPHYTRPTRATSTGQLFDEISNAPMSTGHALARFWIPFLCGYNGLALFTDSDVIFREDIANLFALADPRYAVQVVQHPPIEIEGLKKSGQVQQAYPRKLWSSVVLWNCGHPANAVLTLEALNTWTGRDLHAFKWLFDPQIGALPERWNYLVGLSPHDADPALAHFTTGTPNIGGHDEDQFADEWWGTSRAAGYRSRETRVATEV
jgi:hypothetical protein